jgi:hypothetical protein
MHTIKPTVFIGFHSYYRRPEKMAAILFLRKTYTCIASYEPRFF